MMNDPDAVNQPNDFGATSFVANSGRHVPSSAGATERLDRAAQRLEVIESGRDRFIDIDPLVKALDRLTHHVKRVATPAEYAHSLAILAEATSRISHYLAELAEHRSSTGSFTAAKNWTRSRFLRLRQTPCNRISQMTSDRGTAVSPAVASANRSPPLSPALSLRDDVLSARNCIATIGISLLDMPPEGWPPIIENVVSASRRERVVPIFIVNRTSFAALRRHNVLFEFVSAAEPDSDIDSDGVVLLFQRRRLDRIKTKWGIQRIVYFGPLSPTSAILLR